jgi:hypothetical protein
MSIKDVGDLLPLFVSSQEEGKDNDLLSTFDARIWAKRFVKRVTANPSIATDDEVMHTWFAGAIRAGFDYAKRGGIA